MSTTGGDLRPIATCVGQPLPALTVDMQSNFSQHAARLLTGKEVSGSAGCIVADFLHAPASSVRCRVVHAVSGKRIIWK